MCVWPLSVQSTAGTTRESSSSRPLRWSRAATDVVLVAIGDQPSPFETFGIRVIPLPRRKRALRWMTWLSTPPHRHR